MPTPPAAIADLGALAGLAPALATTFVSIASDIALVIDADGVVRDLAVGEAPIGTVAQRCLGCPLVETVTDDSRSKVEALLDDVRQRGVSRRREVSLLGLGGDSIPMALAAIRLGQGGPVLAVGRDLRPIAAIQQRFLDVQQALERDYWQRRQAEARYRLLFQVATDAVLVVDAGNFQVLEANRAATALWGAQATPVGQRVSTVVETGARPAVDALLATARSSGLPAEIRVRLAQRPPGAAVAMVDIAATPFRASGEQPQHGHATGHTQLLLLVRLRSSERADGDVIRRLVEFVEQTPDAVAITDTSGRLRSANPAFLALCGASGSDQVVQGLSLPEALGDPDQRLGALVDEVRAHGIAAQVRLQIGGRVGSGPGRRPAAGGRPAEPLQEVEISAALLAEGEQQSIGFTLRRLAGRSELPLPPVGGLALAIETLAAQLGRVSLPELVQEASHLAERHLLQSALTRANGHAGTAADWLGITPESLALRLARHGLDADGEAPPLLN